MNPIHLRTSWLWPSCAISRGGKRLQSFSTCRVASNRATRGRGRAKLLNRAPRRVSLTVAGEVMLEEARRVLLQLIALANACTKSPVGRWAGSDRCDSNAWPLSPAGGSYEYRAAHPTFELQFQSHRSMRLPSASSATIWTWQSSLAGRPRANYGRRCWSAIN